MSETTHPQTEQEVASVEAEKAAYRKGDVQYFNDLSDDGFDKQQTAAKEFSVDRGIIEGLDRSTLLGLIQDRDTLAQHAEDFANDTVESGGLEEGVLTDELKKTLIDANFKSQVRRKLFPESKKLTMDEKDVADRAMRIMSIPDAEEIIAGAQVLDDTETAAKYREDRDEAIKMDEEHNRQRTDDLLRADNPMSLEDWNKKYPYFEAKRQAASAREGDSGSEDSGADTSVTPAELDELFNQPAQPRDGAEGVSDGAEAHVVAPEAVELKTKETEGSVESNGAVVRRKSSNGSIKWDNVTVDANGDVHARMQRFDKDGEGFLSEDVTYSGEHAKQFLHDRDVLGEEDPTPEQLESLSAIELRQLMPVAGSSNETGSHPSGGSGGEALRTPQGSEAKKKGGLRKQLGFAATLLALTGTLGGIFGASAAPQSHQSHGKPAATASAPTHRG